MTLVVRAESLDAGMSHYLVRQVEGAPNIEVRLGTEVVGGGGETAGWSAWSSAARRRSDGDGAGRRALPDDRRPPEHGLAAGGAARGRTAGSSCTGADVENDGSWPLERSPFSLETSMPGVFAAGDVRHGSMNRVASAVGEGSIAIKLVHELFAAEQLHLGDRV